MIPLSAKRALVVGLDASCAAAAALLARRGVAVRLLLHAVRVENATTAAMIFDRICACRSSNSATTT